MIVYVKVECKDNRIQFHTQCGNAYHLHSCKPADLYRGHILHELFQRIARRFPEADANTTYDLLCDKTAELKDIIRKAAQSFNIPH